MSRSRNRTPLNAEQRADAARLAAAFRRVKAARRAKGEEKVTQAAMAAACGWETQSAASQYINGAIPLNVSALLRISAYLDVPPQEISPSLSQEIAAGKSIDLSLSELDPTNPQQIADLLRALADVIARLR